jgi:hypothetical protein
MFSKFKLASATLLLFANVRAVPTKGNGTSNGNSTGNGELPIIDLGYSLHQASFFNVSYNLNTFVLCSCIRQIPLVLTFFRKPGASTTSPISDTLLHQLVTCAGEHHKNQPPIDQWTMEV